MYIFKNAFVSIFRNKGRNVLIGIIVMVISCACAVTLAIRNTASNIVNAYQEKYDITATLELNRDSVMSNFTPGEDNQEANIEKFNEIESLTEDEIINYGESDYVDSYYYTMEIGMDSDDIEETTSSLEKVTTNTTTTTNFGGGMGKPGGGQHTTTTTTEEIRNKNAANGEFSIVGYSSIAGMTDFATGKYTITDGEVFTDFTGNECVINKELATLNNLEVGDEIEFVDPDKSSNTYTLTISGIYEDNEETDSAMAMFTNSANKIITTIEAVKNISSNNSDMSVTLNPTYILKSKDDIELFSEEVVNKGLNDYYKVTNNLEVIESATASVTNVKNFATTFLIVTLIIGAVVLLVINMINVRERKYEIGVLRTIGMKKIMVISQFVFELLVVSCVGLLLGAVIGSASSVKISNSLLSSEIENSTKETSEIENNFGHNNIGQENNFSGVANINEISDINAVVDFKVLLELLGIGLCLTLVSSAGAMISISRFSPLTILKERS